MGHWEPSKYGAVWVSWAVGCCVVVLEAVLASSNGSGSARKGLIVEAWVSYGPVQVLVCQCLPPKLAVVTDPPSALIVPLRSCDGHQAKSLGAFSRVHSTKEYLSIHKGFARAGGCPGPCGISPSKVTSDISINSSSRILFTNLGGKAAPGLKGPGVEIGEALGRVGTGAGVAAPEVDAEEAAAAASRCRPVVVVAKGSGAKVGNSVAGTRVGVAAPVVDRAVMGTSEQPQARGMGGGMECDSCVGARGMECRPMSGGLTPSATHVWGLW
jgi:hypothetical protein